MVQKYVMGVMAKRGYWFQQGWMERDMKTADNFTRIPNDFMDLLFSPSLTAAETKVLLFIARKTWGWQKESDTISYSQFRKETGLSQPTLVKTLKKLRVVKFVNLVRKGSSRGDCNEWQIDTNNVPEKVVNLLNLRLIDTEKVVKLLNHTKEIYTKESLAAVEEILSLKKEKAVVKNNRLFVNGKLINNPASYLKKIKEENPTPQRLSDSYKEYEPTRSIT